MEVIRVQEGGRPLKGEITAGGAKNATLPILAATVLEPARYILRDVPRLRDVFVMADVLKALGGTFSFAEDGTVYIDTRSIEQWEVPDPLMRKMRASILFMGPLLGRFGKVKISQPGGCSIGPRPIDLHVRGFETLGASFEEKHGFLMGNGNQLQGREVHLDFPSVGATENIMLGAVKARGQTIIRNAAKEPEIVDLQNFLNHMGSRILGAGTDVIKIDGERPLQGIEHTIIPDRIEVGTYLIAAAITRGNITIHNVIPEHLDAVISKLREAGFDVEERGDSVSIDARRVDASRPVDIKTMPYPGFPTDMQPQFMALQCLAAGTSVLTENIFENRMKHAEELKRMGARIRVEGRTAIVQGVSSLHGAVVESPPALRAGAALVLAGLAAQNETIVTHISHIERGYEGLTKKLASLGARIEQVSMDAYS